MITAPAVQTLRHAALAAGTHETAQKLRRPASVPYLRKAKSPIFEI
jgi:hypothetical protein